MNWEDYLITPKEIMTCKESDQWLSSKQAQSIKSKVLLLLRRIRYDGISTKPKYLREGILELKLASQAVPFRLYL